MSKKTKKLVSQLHRCIRNRFTKIEEQKKHVSERTLLDRVNHSLPQDFHAQCTHDHDSQYK